MITPLTEEPEITPEMIFRWARGGIRTVDTLSVHSL